MSTPVKRTRRANLVGGPTLVALMLLQLKLLIADEPTTALDCVVQTEVLDRMLELIREEGAALIVAAHAGTDHRIAPRAMQPAIRLAPTPARERH
jgi:ABC-type dipeptide/oligopeptide/nickel transport system ATPase subunit